MEKTGPENIQANALPNEEQPLSIDADKMDNAVLKRLIGEIDFEKANRLHAYNRTHNRHNRGR